MGSKPKKRICIVSRSLAEGGADRVAAMQSIFLSELGYEVYIVTILNSLGYPYQGKLLNLGNIKEENDTIIGRFKRLLLFRRFLRINKIDIVIDHRVRLKPFSEHIISAFVFPRETIYVVHNYFIELYFPKIKWLTKILYSRAKQIVSVSKNIQVVVKEEYNFKNLSVIYNPIDFEYINQLKNKEVDIKEDYIFWYGRFEDEQKNISLLIDAYQRSDLPQKNIKLILMGNGKDKAIIEQKVFNMNLSGKIHFLRFSTNPFAYINASKFTVLSSRFEGFPMTILESLACETPVVCVKYQNYTNGIIKDAFNGLLIENHNPKLLADAFNRFIDDEKLYLSCKSNTLESVKLFDVCAISKEWQNLIEN